MPIDYRVNCNPFLPLILRLSPPLALIWGEIYANDTRFKHFPIDSGAPYLVSNSHSLERAASRLIIMFVKDADNIYFEISFSLSFFELKKRRREKR
jgi:hypothetical protein